MSTCWPTTRQRLKNACLSRRRTFKLSPDRLIRASAGARLWDKSPKFRAAFFPQILRALATNDQMSDLYLYKVLIRGRVGENTTATVSYQFSCPISCETFYSLILRIRNCRKCRGRLEQRSLFDGETQSYGNRAYWCTASAQAGDPETPGGHSHANRNKRPLRTEHMESNNGHYLPCDIPKRRKKKKSIASKIVYFLLHKHTSLLTIMQGPTN